MTQVRSAAELAALIGERGILSAFQSRVVGFSAQEYVDPAFWFPETGEGFWEWKGPAIRLSGCAYGRLFSSRPAFVMPALYRELANYRRDGYDFDARYEEGLARYADKQVYDTLAAHGSLLSSELGRLCPLPGDRKSYADILTRLQMQGYVLVSNFEYQIGKNGQPYGWGVARYETPEHYFGAEFSEHVYDRTPEESGALVLARLGELLTDVPERTRRRLLG